MAQTMAQDSQRTPRRHQRFEIAVAELPLHCPLDSMTLWNSHPRVYLPIEESGRAVCPYCGTEYTLKRD
ncbi:MAG: zinc-finger domain-containing protein [Gammaproteobacteria bacterium]|nr:zinc-finger domain-containing protein [Gammaproteobacteria bacterium]